MNILAACSGAGLAGAQVRLQVARPTTTAASRTTRRSSPRRCAARTRRARRSSATSSRPRTRSRDFAERNPDVTVTMLRFANVLGPDVRHRAHRACSRLPVVPDDPRLRPALPVRARGRRRRTRSSTRRQRRCPASTTSPPTGCSRCRRSIGPARQALAAGAAAVGHRLVAGPLRRLGFADPGRDASTSCASAAGSTTAAQGDRASATATRRARPCSGFGEHLRLAPILAGGERALPLRARGRGVPALEPAACGASSPGTAAAWPPDREPLGI